MINPINSTVYPMPISPVDPNTPTIMAPLPIKRGSSDFHVVPSNGLWAVKAEHLQFHVGYWYTKTEAMAYAIQQARDSASMVVVHGRNGKIQEVRDYNSASRFNDNV